MALAKTNCKVLIKISRSFSKILSNNIGKSMKRYNNLYPKIISYENLELAHKKAQKGKKHYPEVVKFNNNSEYYLYNLQNLLVSKTFINSKYNTFIKKGKKKNRVIYRLPYFPDRVTHHAIMNICEPIWQKTLIRDTYAALKNRGIHDGVNRMKSFLQDRENTKYCLKMDIKKFYPSVNNDILYYNILSKKIKCKDTLWLFKQIVYSTVGLPIGNYLSQIWGNLYLSVFDWFIKQEKRIKYYCRYCDDLVILHHSKQYLHELKLECDKWLWNNLKLEIKDDWQIFPRLKRPIDFLGYVFCDEYILVRKDIVKTFKYKINYIKRNWRNMEYTQIINTIMSYYGWFKHANAYNLWIKYIDNDIKRIMWIICKNNHIKNPLLKI